MEEDSASESPILDFAKKNWLILLLLCGGILFFAIGIVQMTGQKTASVKFEKGESVADVEASETIEIKVDVAGQVERPGVYSLKSDSRVQDALIAAGGLSEAADRNKLNLAQKISDGQKIYVPAQGESTTSIISTTGITGETSVGMDSNGMISVNNGSQSELESLPGIGPVTAGKIIDGRPYGSTEEILSKKAVGKATYEKIKDLISL